MVRRMRPGRADQDVGRIDRVLEKRDGFPVAVEEFHGDFSRALRHRNEEYILERFRHAGRFFGILPFLEKRGERIGIKYFTGILVLDGQLAVPGQVQLVGVDPAAPPSIQGVHLGKGNLRGLVGAGKDIIQAKGLVLGGQRNGRQ